VGKREIEDPQWMSTSARDGRLDDVMREHDLGSSGAGHDHIGGVERLGKVG
jgi:hypothetical protein